MENSGDKMENIVIIGAGPAGISAALYAARGNMNPLVINNGIGALEKAEKIENYYGLEQPLSGKELYERGIAQAKALGVRILDAEVLGISGFDTFTVKTTAGDFDTVSVILATGGKRSAPKIPGLKEFEGRGVSYCAVCDAFFYRGKEVAVVGNGDFALHEAEELRNVTQDVTIYTDGKEPEFSREHPIAVNTMKIQAIEGDDKVSGLLMQSDIAAQDAEAPEVTRYILLPLFDLPDVFHSSALFKVFSMLTIDGEQAFRGSYAFNMEYMPWLGEACGWSFLIWSHSLYVLGGSFWYKRAFLKTLGTLIVISILGSIITVQIVEWIGEEGMMGL